MISHPAFSSLLESLLEAILIVHGEDMCIRSANLAAAQLLGTAPDDLVGRPVADLAVTPEDIFFWDEAARGVATEIFSETTLCRKDGSTIRVDRRVSRLLLDDGSQMFVVGIVDQSDRQKIEDELEKLVAELRATLESTGEGILVLDLQNNIRSYNQRFSELWELPDALMTRRDDQGIHSWLLGKVLEPEGYEARLATLARFPLMEATDVVVLRSGRVLERHSMPQYARGRPIGRVFSFRDITRRLADEGRLRLAAKVFASSLDAIMVTDASFRIVAANPRSVALSGHSEADMVGHPLSDFYFTPKTSGTLPLLEETFRETDYWEGELWHQPKDGTLLPGLASIVRVQEDAAQPPQFIVFFKDLTEQFAANKRIEELAYYDILTGLPNRVLLKERLNFAMNWSRRENRCFAVLFMDLDRFKQINDSLGHAFGDKILIQVAQRVRTCLRHTDTAARLGGDEFLVLLHDVDAHGAELAATRIAAALSRSFDLEGMSFAVTASIGIALFPKDGDNDDDLLKNADTAMYQAKHRGHPGFCFYHPGMNEHLLERMQLDHAMREGLANGHFRLHYQPKVELESLEITGVEALLRWQDPVLGSVSPGRFIPVAEETGFIATLGEWVLQEAVAQAVRWKQEGLALQVAINVSALQFHSRAFVDSVSRALADTGLPAGDLELELTESILIQDAEEALRRLTELSSLGLQISIDDFGTGYSNLAYLKRFPIQTLKIDRSFVDGLPDEESDAAIVGAIINLARSLHLKVVAEGVETAGQRDALKAMGCTQYQGFLTAPALPPEALAALVRKMAR